MPHLWCAAIFLAVSRDANVTGRSEEMLHSLWARKPCSGSTANALFRHLQSQLGLPRSKRMVSRKHLLSVFFFTTCLVAGEA
jgi:hypothetical protein